MAITAEAKKISDSINAIPNLSSNSAHKYSQARAVVANAFNLNKENIYLYTLSSASQVVVRSQQVQMQVNKGSHVKVVLAICTFNHKNSTAYEKYAVELMNSYDIGSVLYCWKNSSNDYIPELAFGVINSELVEKIRAVWPTVKIEELVSKTSHRKEIQKGKGENIIFFGAPGTGKSHRVKELTSNNKNQTVRITFHPEYDHAAFVGGYKPTMDGDNIKYDFVPQAFTEIYIKAWNSCSEGAAAHFFLVIEEINRGNCAEIFGDIFQLLDRDSDYDISPSKEMKEYLLRVDCGLKNPNLGLKDGLLKLPPNLSILATMNTSDQSLFPMDSAFKRRWDWEYVPINYEEFYVNEQGESKVNESFGYRVSLSDGDSFKWIKFIEAVNKIIKRNPNLGMDKCIGNYFIKPDGSEISLKAFINKAIFYLWNDVFKDETEEDTIFRSNITFEDFFPIDVNGLREVRKILGKDVLDILESTSNENSY